MNGDKRREVLAEYLDQRVILTGVFERLTTNKNPAKPYKVALLQDVEVELSRAKYDIGHIWIQHAETFASFTYGDRVQCSCRVGQYKKSLATPGEEGAVKLDYSLSWPTDVKVLSRPVALRTAHEEPAASPTNGRSVAEAPARPAERPADPLQLILEVKGLAEKVGGVEKILEVKAAIDRAGGWDRLLEIHHLAESLGGWDRLEQLLSLLKL